MYCIFSFNVICFLKFIVHKINYEIIKSEIVKLTRRENADVTDADMIVGWMVYVGDQEGEIKLMWHGGEGERESALPL
jgi:hypothetical protein